MEMTIVTERPRIKLQPEDFRTQLWIGLSMLDGTDVMPRYEIAWRQKEIDLKVFEDGTYYEFQVYDRPQGGEALIKGYIDPPVVAFNTKLKGWSTTIRLFCNFWP